MPTESLNTVKLTTFCRSTDLRGAKFNPSCLCSSSLNSIVKVLSKLGYICQSYYYKKWRLFIDSRCTHNTHIPHRLASKLNYRNSHTRMNQSHKQQTQQINSLHSHIGPLQLLLPPNMELVDSSGQYEMLYTVSSSSTLNGFSK